VDVVPIFNRYTLRHVVDFVYSNKSGSELEHVVSQRDDDELGVLRALFDVTRYN